jgi:magnesium chelatase subunit D
MYPFSAIVGHDDLRLALLLNAVHPAIGGVLVRGEKGTAKSTIVRGLAALLPPVDVVEGCRFSCDPGAPDPGCPDGPHSPGATRRPARLVELPVGATEDRLAGSLDLERALTGGVRTYQPGLLCAAHRGVLYVDEVNLLHDHLVDLLLDAAAMGRAHVERDGVSVSHAASFLLVGTMNPEEGELRPQLLDRFGLTVEVAAAREVETRAEVIRRRLAYEADPGAFAATWSTSDGELASRIVTARKALAGVALPDAELRRIAALCAAFDVDGMRADIVTARAASAHAAWNGRTDVLKEDIRAAARLALPHRRRRNPFDAPGIDEDLLDQILDDDDEPEPPPPPPQDEDDGSPLEDGPEPAEQDGSPSEPPPPQQQNDSPGIGAQDVTVAASGQPYRPRLFTVAGTGAGESGHRSRAVTEDGRRIGAERPGVRTGSIHLTETIRAAAPHQGTREREGRRIAFRPDDLRVAVREGHESNLVLFCVDASGSMAARRRMEQVKTAILSLLLDAYQRRDKVGLITFRGGEATLALPPTSSVDIAAVRLEELPAGGRTPLAEGLLKAAEALRLEHVRDPHRRPLLVVVTDGRATHGDDALARAHAVADHLADTGVASVVVDCETGRFRLGLALQLADALRAEHVPLGDVSASALTDVVRGAA